MDTEPVMLHELDPTDHRTVGRVDLAYFHPLAADLHVGAAMLMSTLALHSSLIGEWLEKIHYQQDMEDINRFYYADR